MSIKNKLPKAPSFGENNVTDELKDQLTSLEPDLSLETEEVSEPNVEQQNENNLENDTTTAPAHSGIRPELMDVTNFNETLTTASRARMLAAKYTKLAESGSLPDPKLLASDAALAEAVQTALVQQAEKFDKISRNVLSATLEDSNGEASLAIMESNDIKTVNALHDIAFPDRHSSLATD